MVALMDFLEKGENRVLVIYATPQGQLMPATEFPNTSKTKVSHSSFLLQCWRSPVGNMMDYRMNTSSYVFVFGLIEFHSAAFFIP